MLPITADKQKRPKGEGLAIQEQLTKIGLGMSDWLPVEQAKVDGTLCALRFRDTLGQYDSMESHFLHDDGYWYLLDPPTRIGVKPTHFLPIFVANEQGA